MGRLNWLVMRLLQESWILLCTRIRRRGYAGEPILWPALSGTRDPDGDGRKKIEYCYKGQEKFTLYFFKNSY